MEVKLKACGDNLFLIQINNTWAKTEKGEDIALYLVKPRQPKERSLYTLIHIDNYGKVIFPKGKRKELTCKEWIGFIKMIPKREKDKLDGISRLKKLQVRYENIGFRN